MQGNATTSLQYNLKKHTFVAAFGAGTAMTLDGHCRGSETVQNQLPVRPLMDYLRQFTLIREYEYRDV